MLEVDDLRPLVNVKTVFEVDDLRPLVNVKQFSR